MVVPPFVIKSLCTWLLLFSSWDGLRDVTLHEN